MRRMTKASRMTKRVDAVGTSAGNGEFDPPVPFVFRDGKTGRAKCACYLEVADTIPRKAKGLSKRASLESDHGMLFQNCTGPFWMKDTEFPLDLVFVDRDGVVTEKQAMAVDRECRNLYPARKSASEHAVELPLGFCSRNGIVAGDVLLPFGERE